jgi:unsaturated chondroitin disaccharide hydrolase
MKPNQSIIDIDRILRAAARKLGRFDALHPGRDRFPSDAKGAEWTTVAVHDWESGFYPGALWYVYEHAVTAGWPDAAEWRARAEAWTDALAGQQFNDTHHDLGFVIFDSFGHGYRLTGNPDYKPVILRAAETLASRYRPETGMIRSWGRIDDSECFTVIMDNMMNLELLIWAADHGGGEFLRETAIRHADRTIELFFRPDGGTYHVVDLDPRDGRVLRKHTNQGRSADSTWSRGQAWAIYGFTYMYGATRERRYLDTALMAASHYLSRTSSDRVPPADFDGGLEGLEFKDSSTAAVVAAAFLRLHSLVDQPVLKRLYLGEAREILRQLASAPYFSEGESHASVLRFAARNYCEDPDHRLTNTSLIWGDYYFLEALRGLAAAGLVTSEADRWQSAALAHDETAAKT